MIAKSVTEAYKVRDGRHKALRLLASASSRLSEAGLKRCREEKERRRRLISSRRQKLRQSFPALTQKRRFSELLRIHRRQTVDKPASVDLDEDSESLSPRNEPKKMPKLQTYIRSFFKVFSNTQWMFFVILGHSNTYGNYTVRISIWGVGTLAFCAQNYRLLRQIFANSAFFAIQPFVGLHS